MTSPRPSTRHSAPVVEGEILAGRYEVVRVIGAGGMGVVVEARHLQLGQRVALKFLLTEECRSEEAVGRFLREGRAAVQITSEHVARVSDVGTLENGAPYIVMEYLEGEDLSEVLASRGTFAIREAVEYVLQAGEAIAEAHALGIIHRDLKPANLFLTRRADGSPLIKVLDFGISKLDDPQQVSLTASTGAMGSPQYMSPEQMRSAKHVDRRTDIWALGAILYELVTGRPPFEADSLIGLCTLVATKDAPPLRERCADAPEALETTIAKCLRREPADRYPTLAELAIDLLPFVGQAGKTSAHRIVTILKDAGLADAVPIPAGSEPKLDLPVRTEDPVAIGQTTEWALKTAKHRSRTTILMASIGLAAALSLIGAVWVSYSSRGATDEPRPEEPIMASAVVVPVAPNAADAEVDVEPVAVLDAQSDAPPDAVASAPGTSATAPASTGKTGRPPSTKTVPTSTGPAANTAPAPTATGKLPDFGGRHY